MRAAQKGEGQGGPTAKALCSSVACAAIPSSDCRAARLVTTECKTRRRSRWVVKSATTRRGGGRRGGGRSTKVPAPGPRYSSPPFPTRPLPPPTSCVYTSTRRGTGCVRAPTGQRRDGGSDPLELGVAGGQHARDQDPGALPHQQLYQQHRDLPAHVHRQVWANHLRQQRSDKVCRGGGRWQTVGWGKGRGSTVKEGAARSRQVEDV